MSKHLNSKDLWRVVLLGIALTALLVSGSRARDGYDWAVHPDSAEMQRIPAAGQRCSGCHAAPGVDDASFVVPRATVNGDRQSWTPVGWDWYFFLPGREGARRWSDLARLNSDGDGCSNGFEISEHGSDPNTGGDCTLPITEDSWSTLKALFSDPR